MSSQDLHNQAQHLAGSRLNMEHQSDSLLNRREGGGVDRMGLSGNGGGADPMLQQRGGRSSRSRSSGSGESGGRHRLIKRGNSSRSRSRSPRSGGASGSAAGLKGPNGGAGAVRRTSGRGPSGGTGYGRSGERSRSGSSAGEGSSNGADENMRNGSRSNSKERRGGRFQEKHRISSGGNRRGDEDFYGERRMGGGGPDRYGRNRNDSREGDNFRRRDYKQPRLNEPLVSFKTFLEMQTFPLQRDQTQRFYDDYKSLHDKRQAEIFFSLHQEESWFREKYDPELAFKWESEKKAQSRVLAQKFVDQFIDGSAAQSLKLEQDPTKDYEKLIMSKTDEITRAPIFGYDVNSMTLYLNRVPKHISRWELLEAIRDNTPGFLSLCMGDPLRSQEFERYAWISYDSDENCKKAKEILEQTRLQDASFRLTPVQNSAQRKSIMITPELSEDSVERDLALCKRLIQDVFDAEKEIPSEIFDKIQEYASQSLSTSQHLDLLLLYLRKVHAYCFYCGEEYDDERTLAARCGPQHLRNAKTISRSLMDTEQQNFEDKYLKAAQQRLEKGPRETFIPSEDNLLKSMKQEYAERKTKVIQAGQVYQCEIKDCQKRFKTIEFVHKHISNKHGDLLDEKFNKSRFEAMFRENYFNDPRKMINQPGTGSGFTGHMSRGGPGGGRGFRGGRYDEGRGGGADRGRYVDYDDPTRYKDQLQNPERQIVSYDDLF